MYDGLSTVLGYASILAWLGAQMPQVYENYKNQSVEGLALPFLTSWMIGDATNLIGCVLTHQLPFQTYLATYFVFVDFCLLSQYAYYSSLRPSFAPLPPSPHTTPRLGETPRQSYIRAARSETWTSSAMAPGAHYHSHSHSHSSHRADGSARHHAKRTSKSSSRRTGSKARRSGDDSDPMSASWLSESSSTVTHSPSSALKGARKAAAASSSHAGDSSSPGHSQPTSPLLPAEPRGRTLFRPLPPPTRRQQALHHTGAFGDLETISGSPSTSTSFHAPGLQVAFDPTAHVMQPHNNGAAHHLTEDEEEQREFDWGRHQRGTSSNSRSRPPPMARRTNSMVFLSVGLFVSFGRWSSFGTGEAPSQAPTRAWSADLASRGQIGAQSVTASVWEGLQHPAFFGAKSPPRTSMPVARRALVKRETFPLELSTASGAHTQSGIASEADVSASEVPSFGDEDEDSDEPWYPHRNWERFIGRASAWLCTSLYLTSRLPQIWQNFRRRSVEGLAMMLFVMAFVGNSLYVLSILTNPLMRSPGYILESIPYLLGSGGTLCFDITIVIQSWIYDPKRMARREFERRRAAFKSGLGEEEEEALLRHESEADDGDLTPRRSRSRAVRSAGVPNGSGSRPSSLRPSAGSRAGSRTSRKSKSSSSSRSASRRREEVIEARELEDRTFDWGAVEVNVNGEGPAGERSTSQRRPLTEGGGERQRTVSAPMLSGGAEPSIAEEGESAVTIRAQ